MLSAYAHRQGGDFRLLKQACFFVMRLKEGNSLPLNLQKQ